MALCDFGSWSFHQAVGGIEAGIYFLVNLLCASKEAGILFFLGFDVYVGGWRIWFLGLREPGFAWQVWENNFWGPGDLLSGAGVSLALSSRLHGVIGSFLTKVIPILVFVEISRLNLLD